MDAFLRQQGSLASEKGLIKACDPTVWQNVLLSDVRVTASGIFGKGKRRKGKKEN